VVHPARELWHRLEAIHAVLYFDDYPREVLRDAGMRGFWMGYFAARSAPMGPVNAPVVTATFFNFHPGMVQRAIPDAWSFSSCEQILEARRTSTVDTITRIVPDVVARAEQVTPVLEFVVDAAPDAGRPLFAANRAVDPGDDPVARLWQAATALREHRGDGHVAALTTLDVDGCEAHVLAAGWKGLAPEMIRAARGWSEDDWTDAVHRLRGRGWIGDDGDLTDKGRDARAQIEHHTDVLAWSAYRVLDDEADALLEGLRPLSDAVLDSGVISFPNPMGLPLSPEDP
jgi:hypothetical protein